MAERAARSTAVLVCQGRAIAGGLYAVAGSPIRSDRTGAPYQADQLIVDLVRADPGITDPDGHLPETIYNLASG